MPSPDYHAERRDAHAKWMRFHGVIASLSVATIIGILWAWLFAIRALQHRSASKSHAAKLRNAESP